MDLNIKLSSKDGELISNAEAYKHLIGKLLYLTITCPYICFAVHKLCQYSSAPRIPHIKAAHKVMYYLKGTIGQALFYPVDDDFQVKALCDSDWSHCPDSRRSISWFCIFNGNLLVSWKSNKQVFVSQSSTEAEYRSMAFTTKEVIWLSLMVNDLQVSSPTVRFFIVTVPLPFILSRTLFSRENQIYREGLPLHSKEDCSWSYQNTSCEIRESACGFVH